jgi:heptosyltransferase-2
MNIQFADTMDSTDMPKTKKIKPETTARPILIIQTAFLGDAVLTTGLVREIKRSFPSSKVDILLIPQTVDLFKYNPYIDRILTLDKRNPIVKVQSFLRLIVAIGKNRYGSAFSVQGSTTSSLLMVMARIPKRIGFDNQILLTDVVPLDRKIHAGKRHLKLLEHLTGETRDSQTEIFWSEKERMSSQGIIAEARKKYPVVLGIAPGSIWNTKRWPEDYFAALMELISGEERMIFLFGGREDRALCDRLIEKSRSNALNMAGKLSILESCALIHELDLMISNDSAPLHIANAVRTDVFALFGPTVREFGFFPFRENDKIFEVDLPCRPCSKHGGKSCPEKHFRCMKNIHPSAVAEAVLSYLRIKKLTHHH